MRVTLLPWAWAAVVVGITACGDDSKQQQQLDARVDLRRVLEQGVPDLQPDQPPAGDLSRLDRTSVDQPRPRKEAGPDLAQLPGNSACTKATPVTLSGGKVAVTGTTVGLVNELGGVKCGPNMVTPLLGPQGYYSVSLAGGKTYRVAVTAAFSGASFYFFSSAAGCTAAGIEKDCQSSGNTGFKLPSLTPNVVKEIYFSTTAAGTFLFAVDGLSAGDSGGFGVEIEEHTAPSNGSCASPQPVPLSGGKATLQASTYGAQDEFAGQLKCGGYSAFTGPQVYYSLPVASGKSYRLKLTPTFSAYLYLFSDTAGCSPGPINLYCGSAGATGDRLGPVNAGTTKTMVFAPSSAGTYLIAIDSSSSSNAGSFVLGIEEFTPSDNGTCVKAQPIVMSGSQATVTGSTLGLSDEFPELKCGGYSTLIGAQAYYTVSLAAGKAYRIDFSPTFSGYVYAFSSAAACTASGIEADCASKGAAGEKWGPSSLPTSMYFFPGKAGTYYLAVDSSTAGTGGQGDFTLDIKEISPPTNGTCATAAPIALTGGKATVKGSTAGAKDEFSTLKCAGYSALSGPQAYYSLSLSQGKVYSFTVTPTSFSAYLYLFGGGASCALTAIESDCGSKGATGGVWGSFFSKGTGYFIPAANGTFILGVDSSSSTAQGEFTLEVEESLLPANATCATAETLTVVAGTPTKVTGNTVGAKDELSTLKCGGYTSFTGPQLYYKADLKAGITYSIGLDSAFTSYLYVFSSSVGCTQSAIETACASKGTSGNMWGPVYTVSNYTFTPTAGGVYTFVVDSSSSTYFGPFTLTIQ